MTLLYPNLCNNEVCYKVTAQYSSKKSISIKNLVNTKIWIICFRKILTSDTMFC